MVAGNFNQLQELVDKVCDNLHLNRTLITTSTVKEAVLAQNLIEETYLDVHLPACINNWRLNNIQESSGDLQEEICKYRAELNAAKKTINALKATIAMQAAELRRQRANFIQDIRGLLHG